MILSMALDLRVNMKALLLLHSLFVSYELCHTSVYMCLVVTCWERTDLLALACGV